MASRAGYVLIEQGKVKLLRSSWSWAAEGIPEMLLAGFAKTWEGIHDSILCDDLFNWLLSGGILMDCDAHRLLFWGGNDIMIRPSLRRQLLPALRLLWPGWTVEWSFHGVIDLADYLHRDRPSIDFSAFDIWFDPDNSLPDDELLCDSGDLWTVITVKKADALVDDYLLRALPPKILDVGPRLLNLLCNRRPDALPYEREIENHAFGGVFFDLTTYEMWIWASAGLSVNSPLEAIGQVWTDWQVHEHDEGIVRQVILSGRNPVPIMIPEDEALADLLKITYQGDPQRLRSLMPLLIAATTEEERRKILQELFQSR